MYLLSDVERKSLWIAYVWWIKHQFRCLMEAKVVFWCVRLHCWVGAFLFWDRMWCIISGVGEAILTGVLCVGTSVRFIDTIKFNQSRQLTSSRELRLTVLLTTKSFCLGFICFFRLIFLFTMHLFKLYSDCFQGCRVVVNLIRLVWRGDNFYLTKW